MWKTDIGTNCWRKNLGMIEIYVGDLSILMVNTRKDKRIHAEHIAII